MEKTMTVKELAEFFGKSEDTIIKHSKKSGIGFDHGVTKAFTKPEVSKVSQSLYKAVPKAVKEAIDRMDTPVNSVSSLTENAGVDQNLVTGIVSGILKGLLPEFEKMVDKKILLASDKMSVVADKMSALPEPEYYAVLGYANVNGVKLTNPELSILGKLCTKLSRDKGIPIRPIHDDRYGHVNSYHVFILNEVFNDLRVIEPQVNFN
jgi:cellobiose-specific phosphotransferase system component IIB